MILVGQRSENIPDTPDSYCDLVKGQRRAAERTGGPGDVAMWAVLAISY